MLRPTALKLLLAASFMLTAYTVFISTNSNLFPCTVRVSESPALRDAPVQTRSTECFLDTARQLGPSGYLSAELTPAGWLVAVLLVAVIPTLCAFALGSLAHEPNLPASTRS
jgi:hypothetical protein